MSTWDDGTRPDTPSIGWAGWARVAIRGGAIISVLLICFPVFLLVRIPESLVFGTHRPVTQWITLFVCKTTFYLMGLTKHIIGVPSLSKGAYVVNHSTWLDIFVLNASARIMFISKEEVRSWPGIGWLARATGTLFIKRNRAEAVAQQKVLADRLISGHRFLFFPEGTSTDGTRILPFKSTLFQSFFAENLRHAVEIQPISLRYHAPEGEDPRFYGWWGDMNFVAGLVKVLAQSPQGSVDIEFHAPLKVDAYNDRKALAAAAEEAVRAGFNRSAPEVR